MNKHNPEVVKKGKDLVMELPEPTEVEIFINRLQNESEKSVAEIEHDLFVLPRLIYKAATEAIGLKAEYTKQKILCVKVSPFMKPEVQELIKKRSFALIDLEARYRQACANKEILENVFIGLRKIAELRKTMH